MTHTRALPAYHVLLASREGKTSYGAWKDDATLLPLQVIEAMAPAVSRAKMELNLPLLKIMPWQWRDAIAVDDMVAIVGDGPDGSRDCPFIGFIQDVDWQMSGTVTVTAAAQATRLLQDVLVWGRWMRLEDQATDVWLSGLPCHFNAGGKPNRYPGTFPGDTADLRFAYDGDPAAEYWTGPQAVRYLLEQYNKDETWLTNGDADAEWGLPPRTPLLDCNVEGANLWEALAEVGAKSGADVWEKISAATGGFTSTVKVQGKHAGPAKFLNHAAMEGGQFAPADLKTTNLFECSIAESTSSCLTRPVVAGGRTIVEVTFELVKAFNPVEDDEAVQATNNSPNIRDRDWWKKYATTGELFRRGLFTECGRLWDANTDGQYTNNGMGRDIPDVDALADFTECPIPLMPFKPLPVLTSTAFSGAGSGDVVVEMTLDAGNTWFSVSEYDVLPDRVGIRLTMENPKSLLKPKAVDPAKDNYWTILAETPSNVRMRMTCSIALPVRAWAWPAANAGSAGTAFETMAFLDKGSAGGFRYRASSSILKDSGGTVNASDEQSMSESNVLMQTARRVQGASEGRLIEGNMAIEWPDEDIHLGDCIAKINGIEYSLGSNAGPAKIFPRVVGRTLHLTADTMNMSLLLDTDRKAGIR